MGHVFALPTALAIQRRSSLRPRAAPAGRTTRGRARHDRQPRQRARLLSKHDAADQHAALRARPARTRTLRRPAGGSEPAAVADRRGLRVPARRLAGERKAGRPDELEPGGRDTDVAGRAGRPTGAGHLLDRASTRQAPTARGARSAAGGSHTGTRYDRGARPCRLRHAARQQARALRLPRCRPRACCVRGLPRRPWHHTKGACGRGPGRGCALWTRSSGDGQAGRVRRSRCASFTTAPHPQTAARRRAQRDGVSRGRATCESRLHCGRWSKRPRQTPWTPPPPRRPRPRRSRKTSEPCSASFT